MSGSVHSEDCHFSRQISLGTSVDKYHSLVVEDGVDTDDNGVVDEHLPEPQGCCGHLFPAGYKQELKATLGITYGMVSTFCIY